MTLEELQGIYLDDLRRQRRTLSTVNLYRRWLEGFLQFCAARGVVETGGLSPDLLPAYHQSVLSRLHNRKGRRYSANSVHQMLYTLRGFLRWAHQQGHVAQDMGASVELPRLMPAGPLGPAEVELLYHHAGTEPLGLRDAALVAVFFEAELQLNEALQLDVEDVRLSERQLLVRQAGGSRVEGVSDRLSERLRAYLEQGREHLRPPVEEKAVFLNRAGLRLSAYAVLARLRNMGERAGLAQALHPKLLARSGSSHRGSPNRFPDVGLS